MEIPRFEASAVPEAVAEALAVAGCAIVERLVSASQREEALRELAPYLDATPAGADDFAGRRTRRTGGLIARSPRCREFVAHPFVQGVVGRVLAHATNYQVHLTQMIAIGPGEPAQLIPMPAGSVVFYTGSLYHGAGANLSDHVRYGLNLTYAVAWLRQEENQYLSVPPEIARTLPDPLLRLMGYARGAYALGYVDDVRDPLDALRGTKTPGGSLGDVASARAGYAQATATLRGPE